MLLGITLLVVVFASGVIFWAWWAVPVNRVPPHLTPEDLNRLTTEDKLRQTTYQMLAGGALVLTFSLSAYQAASSYNQWMSDHELRTRQAEVAHLSEVFKALSFDKPAARVAAYYSLRQLAVHYPVEGFLANGVLSNSIRVLAAKGKAPPESALSGECGGSGNAERDEADPEIQIAMSLLGDEKLSKLRTTNFNGKVCIAKEGTTSLTTVNLSHLLLDNLDLNGADLSCIDLSQSSFRRTNLRDTNLKGANLSGVALGDWSVPGFQETINKYVPKQGGAKRAEWLHRESSGWQRYRCWIADFRGADLTGAQFYGAGLEGADFQNSILSDVKFDGANISRANFKGATVRLEQLQKACADDQPLHDFNGSISKCAQ